MTITIDLNIPNYFNARNSMVFLCLNRRPVKRLYIGTLYFKQFFLTVVTYIRYSGMKSADFATVPRLSRFNSRGPPKGSWQPDLIWKAVDLSFLFGYQLPQSLLLLRSS